MAGRHIFPSIIISYGNTFYIDAVLVKINGKQNYLWRAVDQDSEVVDVFLQASVPAAK
ncbi:MAG: transposase-like protein [Planctomycetaceae bacterium]